jgi:hypothetical protein
VETHYQFHNQSSRENRNSFAIMKTARFSSVISWGCLALLLASVRFAQAQYTLVPSSDYVNVYFNDGFTTYAGTTDPTPNTANGTGTPLSPYSWLLSSVTPGPVPTGSYNTGSMITANATAQISYQQASLFAGSNSVSQSGVSPVGTSMQLVNTGAGVAELRVDWTAMYTYTGPTTQTPDFLQLNISGAVNNYTIVAGEENFQVNAGPTLNAGIPIGGDFVTPSSYPGGVNTLANFWGYASPTTSFSAAPSGFAGAQSINNGDTLTVTGFLDMIVDPGSINLTIEPALVPEPGSLALSLVGGLGLFFKFRKRNRSC